MISQLANCSRAAGTHEYPWPQPFYFCPLVHGQVRDQLQQLNRQLNSHRVSSCCGCRPVVRLRAPLRLLSLDRPRGHLPGRLVPPAALVDRTHAPMARARLHRSLTLCNARSLSLILRLPAAAERARRWPARSLSCPRVKP